jgi:four helix bundle protein
VVVTRYEDLVCWQLASELKRQVYALFAQSRVRRDFDFCNQIKRSASSAPANIAEGFAIFRHPESARYARIARASLVETQNHLGDGVDRGYWTNAEIEQLLKIADRAIGATTRWLAYLSSTPTPPSHWQRE